MLFGGIQRFTGLFVMIGEAFRLMALGTYQARSMCRPQFENLLF